MVEGKEEDDEEFSVMESTAGRVSTDQNKWPTNAIS